MVADELDYVIGVDTHRDEHVLAVVVAPTGVVVGEEAVPASTGGYREACLFAGEHAAGTRAWAIEGVGHYGAGLARYLAAQGETVLEISPRREPSGAWPARTTRWPRPGQPVRRLLTRDTRFPAAADDARRFGCC